jgi:hypothetical protein
LTSWKAEGELDMGLSFFDSIILLVLVSMPVGLVIVVKYLFTTTPEDDQTPAGRRKLLACGAYIFALLVIVLAGSVYKGSKPPPPNAIERIGYRWYHGHPMPR